MSALPSLINNAFDTFCGTFFCFSPGYQNFVEKSAAIIEKYRQDSHSQGVGVKGEELRPLAESVMTPFYRARATGICALVGCYVTHGIVKKIPLMSMFAGIFPVIGIAVGFFTWECHKIYSEVREFDRYIINHYQKNIGWDDLVSKIDVCMMMIREETLFVGLPLLFGNDLREIPDALKKLKDGNSKTEFALTGWLIPLITIMNTVSSVLPILAVSPRRGR